MAVEVILDIYSGRENPKWHLAPGEIAELSRQLKLIRKKTDQLPQAPALGYRGFHLHATGENLPAHITVFAGVLQTEKGNFLDEGHALEKWLARKARSVVDAPTYEYLESQVNGK